MGLSSTKSGGGQRLDTPASDHGAYLLDRLPLHRPNILAEDPAHARHHVPDPEPSVFGLACTGGVPIVKQHEALWLLTR